METGGQLRAFIYNAKVSDVRGGERKDPLIALMGNPNTGKSTAFNALTGLRQHTGNWPGKTVLLARGSYAYQGRSFELIDLPGCYSLYANSPDEEVARDFLCWKQPDATVIVVDATCLERNLNLVLQVLEITGKVVVCLNLMDEAKKKRIAVDHQALAGELGVPVVPCAARSGLGMDELVDTVAQQVDGKIITRPYSITYPPEIEEAVQTLEERIRDIAPVHLQARWVALSLLSGDLQFYNAWQQWQVPSEPAPGGDRRVNQRAIPSLSALTKDLAIEPQLIHDQLVKSIYWEANRIATRTVSVQGSGPDLDRKLDNIFTSRWFGFPIMLLMLGVVFWITIVGSNYPSEALATVFFAGQDRLAELFIWLGAPAWLKGILVDGVYGTLAWVVAVMLPPMAIFFPLFTLLEDLGYLPRVAFNLDRFFKRVGAHGKQSLTMAMGFGCNAAGVIACRIIDSPRERLIAVLTNNFVPCNGRFPTLIALSLLFIGGGVGAHYATTVAAASVVGIVLVGVAATLAVSWILSRTILRGLPSSFTLELPPYRVPQIGSVIVRSFLDRTLFVLKRAVIVAAPAGVVIWIAANIHVGEASILGHFVGFLDPFARAIGLDGHILGAFILGLPANEIVLPILIMSYVAETAMLELDSLQALRDLLVIEHNWTWLTAVCTMLFALLHFPCATTLYTIQKEQKSIKWTVLAALIPLAIAITVCFVVAQTVRFLGLV